MASHHRLLIAATAVPLAALAACSSGASDIDGEAIADAIDATIDDAEFDDDVADVDCPVDGWDDIVEDTLADLGDDVIERALDGEPDETAVIDAGAETIDCAFFADDAGAGLFMLEAPRDVDEYTEDFASGDVDDARVDIDPTNVYRGGQFRHVCVDYDDDDAGYCQVEWVDDDVLIGIFVFGDDFDRVDLDDLETAFGPQLDLIAEQFEA